MKICDLNPHPLVEPHMQYRDSIPQLRMRCSSMKSVYGRVEKTSGKENSLFDELQA